MHLAPAILALALAPLPLGEEPPPVDFARDVRPILSEHCFACHGPDEATRAAGLRLDTPDGIRALLDSGAHAVVPGDVDESELVYRIAPEFETDLMPPASFDKPLKDDQIALLRRWVEEGAEWQDHWAFRTPARPELPEGFEGDAPIDAFVRAGLAEVGLDLSPEADRATLLRRASLDLTGLPPTVEELDVFLADERADAYERAIDSLLASPRYGEHMARGWLDAARYADTHGLHLDNRRSMWPYRDWVVEAFNSHKPIDEFFVEQLAGDLLPDPTLDQLVASGFNRCNPTSAEGGMIAKEYLALYAKDRVDTFGTMFLGVTMNCAQCHDHKYDPFEQRDYYQLFGFFNSLTEEASDRNIENPQPFVRVPSDEQLARMEGLRADLVDLDAELARPRPELEAREAEWAARRHAELAGEWLAWAPESATATGGAELQIASDRAIVASGANPAKTVYELRGWVPPGAIEALRVEALAPEGQRLPGRATNENFVLSEVEIEAAPAGTERFQRVRIAETAASWSQDKWPIAAAIDGDPNTGWAGLGRDGDRRAAFLPDSPFGHPSGTELRVRLRFESVHEGHAFARFRIALDHSPGTGLGWGVWHRAFLPYDNVQNARRRVTPVEERAGELDLTAEAAPGVAWTPEPGWEEGAVHMFEQRVGSTMLARYVWSDGPRDVAATLGSDDSVQVFVNGELVHDNPAARAVAADADRIEFSLRPGLNEILVEVSNHGGGHGFQFRPAGAPHTPESLPVRLALETPPTERTAAESEAVRREFRAEHAPDWNALVDARAAKDKAITDFEASWPTTMISKDLDEPRPAHILVRGDYENLGERVEPNVPSILPPLPEGAPRNRLSLARWLVEPDHPLTARVFVNRQWQHFFGSGFVETAEDFGAQGSFPSHPKLLDHLSRDLVDGGWDLQALQKRILLSKTYRQDSKVRAEAVAVDAANRRLAYFPRVRLDAEVLRDSALAVAGLLDETMGGPGVRPYQPPGIWKAVGYSRSNTVSYSQGPREHLHRRSLYTFWKRTAPPPTLTTFDAPSRESCTVRRERTNTPLQALLTQNDPTYVEAARFLASRMLALEAADDTERLRAGFRLVTSRAPDARELAILERALAALRVDFAERPEDALKLLEVGDVAAEVAVETAEHAAWTLVASALLNLDEVIVRG